MFIHPVRLLTVMIVIAASTALAQNESSGITVAVGDGYSAGLRFPLSQMVTLRPSLMFLVSRQDRGTPYSTVNTTSIYALSLDILVHTERIAIVGLTSYVGGGVGLGYFEFKSESKSVPDFYATYADIQRTLQARGIVGAQYSLGQRFSFFGEVGASAGDSPKFDGSNRSISTFSRLGLNLLF